MLWLILVIGILPLLLYDFTPEDKIIKSSNKCDLHQWEYRKQPGDESSLYLQCKQCDYLFGHDNDII